MTSNNPWPFFCSDRTRQWQSQTSAIGSEDYWLEPTKHRGSWQGRETSKHFLCSCGFHVLTGICISHKRKAFWQRICTEISISCTKSLRYVSLLNLNANFQHTNRIRVRPICQIIATLYRRHNKRRWFSTLYFNNVYMSNLMSVVWSCSLLTAEAWSHLDDTPPLKCIQAT